MTVAIFHGIMGYAGENWGAWLSDELTAKGHKVIMPTLPNPDHPDRKQWLKTIETLLKDVRPGELILIGHSIGATSALDYLELVSHPIAGFISVSGIPINYSFDLNESFLAQKSIDFKKVKSQISQEPVVYYGDNDPYVPQEVLQQMAHGLGVKAHVIPNGGHLNASAGFTKFPELLGAVLKLID